MEIVGVAGVWPGVYRPLTSPEETSGSDMSGKHADLQTSKSVHSQHYYIAIYYTTVLISSILVSHQSLKNTQTCSDSSFPRPHHSSQEQSVAPRAHPCPTRHMRCPPDGMPGRWSALRAWPRCCWGPAARLLGRNPNEPPGQKHLRMVKGERLP